VGAAAESAGDTREQGMGGGDNIRLGEEEEGITKSSARTIILMDGWREEGKKDTRAFFVCARTPPHVEERRKMVRFFPLAGQEHLSGLHRSLAAFNWSEESHTRRDKRLSEREKVTRPKRHSGMLSPPSFQLFSVPPIVSLFVPLLILIFVFYLSLLSPAAWLALRPALPGTNNEFK
jgi:hypothetical protein